MVQQMVNRLGEKLFRKRERMGLSLAEMGEKMGITASTLMLVEKGKGCDRTTANKIAKVLELTEAERICLMLKNGNAHHRNKGDWFF